MNVNGVGQSPPEEKRDTEIEICRTHDAASPENSGCFLERHRVGFSRYFAGQARGAWLSDSVL